MKLLKKIAAGFIAAAICAFSCLPAVVYAERDGDDQAEQSEDYDENRIVPELALTSYTSCSMPAGTSAAVHVTFTKRSRGEFSMLKGVMTSSTSDLKIQTKEVVIKSLQDEMMFSVFAPKAAIAGTYDLNLTVTLYNLDGYVAGTQSFTIAMTIKSDLKISGLNIESYKTSIDPVKSGDHFDLTAILNNETNADIENAEISLEGLNADKFIIDKGFQKQFVSIKKGQRGKIVFSLIARNGITLERETLSLNLSYSIDKQRGDTSRQTSTFVIINCVPSGESKDQSYGARDISMTGYSVSVPTVRKGEKFDLTVEVKNSSSNNITGARVSADADGTKFALDTGLGYRDFDIKAGETKSFTFKLIGCNGIASIRESVPVKIEFGSNSSVAYASVVCEPVGGSGQATGKSDIAITGYSTDLNAVRENAVFTLNLDVTNKSTSKIENVRVSLLGLDGSKFAVDSGLTYSDIPMINGGETKQIAFRLIGCKGIASVREVIAVQIDYDDVSAQMYTTVPCVPKTDEGSGDDGKQVFSPNIIIENYDYGGEFVTAGQQFPLTIHIRNMATSAVVENLKVTVTGGVSATDGSRAYSPANSTNSFFFEKLGIREDKTLSIDLLAKADATPNSYPVEISFVYEYSVGDKRFQANERTETITIPLRQEDRLTISEPEVPSWGVSVNEMFTLNMSLVNMGKSAVYNVTATVEGDGFGVETPTYYIGNINSGSEEYYDAKITPFMEGGVMGRILFSYEDSNGEHKEKEIPFQFTAIMPFYGGMEDGMLDDGMMTDDMGEGDSGNLWIWILAIGGGVALIVVIVIIIVVANKKKKKKMAELEDDDNEDI